MAALGPRGARPDRRRHRPAGLSASRRCCRAWWPAGARRRRSVAVLAVDPSSRRSGGSLLGDRARIEREPGDRAGVHPLDRGRRPARRTGARHPCGGDGAGRRVRRGRDRNRRRRSIGDRGRRRRRRGGGDRAARLRRRPAVPQVGDHGDPRRAGRDQVRPRHGRAAGAGGSARRAAARSEPTRYRSSPSPRCRRRPGSTSSSTRSINATARWTCLCTGMRGRRAAALAQFTVEHGERGLRASSAAGARRWAWLQTQPADARHAGARRRARVTAPTGLGKAGRIDERGAVDRGEAPDRAAGRAAGRRRHLAAPMARRRPAGAGRERSRSRRHALDGAAQAVPEVRRPRVPDVPLRRASRRRSGAVRDRRDRRRRTAGLDRPGAFRVGGPARRGRVLAGQPRSRPGPRHPRGAADLRVGLFRRSRLERIELQAAVDNPASQRVAERAGFTREAVLRSRWATFGGERHDMVCFGLLASDR